VHNRESPEASDELIVGFPARLQTFWPRGWNGLMSSGWRRVSRDLRNRRYVDAYSAALVAFVLAVLSLAGDVVPDQLRWAALLAGVGLLVLRITIPDGTQGTLDEVLSDRFAFDVAPLTDRLRDAKEIWIFAPTAVNLLSAQNCEILRTGPLNRPDGAVRVVVLNPHNESAVELATHQLDDSLDYPIQDFRASLQATIRLLTAVGTWRVAGSFGYRLLDYNPGFSLVAIDPSARNGRLIVEFHGFHNEATSSRMHIEIYRGQSDHWYKYWTDQFDRIWEAASLPAGEDLPLGSPR
jgi:hypothetical protein